MRIAYLLHFNDDVESGVWKKVLGQVRIWTKLGANVTVYVVTRISGKAVETLEDSLPQVRIFPYAGAFSRLRAWSLAVNAIEVDRHQVVYWRHDLLYPAVVKLALMKPVFIEVNTNDAVEFCLTKDARCFYHRATRKLAFSLASGIVLVSHELKSILPERIVGRLPIAVIGNGVDLDSIRPLPPPRNEQPRLVFLGSTNQPWQGVDELLTLAMLFPDWHVDVIGPKPSWGEKSPPNVHFHGFLRRAEYEAILARADVAIGPLGSYRKALNEASPLKVREYLAYGLPVILGCKDTDFLEGAPFILELPNQEGSVERNRDQIEQFVLGWMGKRVPREAVLHLDIKVKEEKRLKFLLEVVKNARSAREVLG